MKSTSLFCFAFLACMAISSSAQENGKTQGKQPADSSPGPELEVVSRKIEGWPVKIEKTLLDEDPALAEEAIKALANHLQRVRWIVPKKRLTELQELPIWLGHENKRLGPMQYHPSERWLEQNGHDVRMARHVHVPSAKDLLDRKNWSKHPYCIMHELAHAYHDQVLGFNHPEVQATYQAAKKQEIYKKVLAHTGKTVQHYGLNNAKEYFAESTEAYFGVNDFYPFVRAELKEHDPKMHSLLEKIWGPIR